MSKQVRAAAAGVVVEPTREQIKRAAEDARTVDAITRMFLAVDAIDTWLEAKPPVRYPNRGRLPCPNCAGTLTFSNLTAIKGAARCSGTCGVDFASLY